MFKGSVAGQDHVTARQPREQTDHTSLRLLWSVTAYLHCRTPIQGPTGIRIPNPVVKNMFTLHRLRLWSLLPISAQKSELGSESVSSNLIMQLHRLRSGSSLDSDPKLLLYPFLGRISVHGLGSESVFGNVNELLVVSVQWVPLTTTSVKMSTGLQRTDFLCSKTKHGIIEKIGQNNLPFKRNHTLRILLLVVTGTQSSGNAQSSPSISDENLRSSRNAVEWTLFDKQHRNSR